MDTGVGDADAGDGGGGGGGGGSATMEEVRAALRQAPVTQATREAISIIRGYSRGRPLFRVPGGGFVTEISEISILNYLKLVV